MGEFIPTTTALVVSFPKNHDSDQGDDVERIDPFSFYDFGKKLKALQELSGDVPTNKLFWPLWQAQNAMDELLKGEPIPIGVSSRKATSLRDQLAGIMSERFETKDEEGKARLRFPDETDQPVQEWQIDWLKKSITAFETVFADEMRETATYFVPRRGIFHTPALVDSADDTFPAELAGFIPVKAREDWKAAGRCLAFNLLSASGFHVARAVEATLESYFGYFCNKPGQTLPGWKDYVDALKDLLPGLPSPSPMEKTIAEIDQMRLDYRNPIMHPRVLLGESDARMLFANGESLIIAMAQEIAAATASNHQPGLVLLGGSAGNGAAE